ncbi:MAG TPA: GNAT family N-acetyltransferase [Thermoanaerobaculia bacterium]|nr:GNAT family N-acetyltransferase [Thermoanaerobaculia bacterium]
MANGPSWAIRRAGTGDATPLAALAAATFRDTFAADNTAENMSAYLASAFGEEKQAAELLDPGVAYFVAEEAGAAVGYAELKSGPAPACVGGAKPVELARLYVSREFFGKGLANALMDRCLDEARSRAFETIWLGVWEKNLRAQAFYRRWGFTRVGEHLFLLGTDPQTDWLMERAL